MVALVISNLVEMGQMQLVGVVVVQVQQEGTAVLVLRDLVETEPLLQ
jgi:hypothetical protein